MKSIREIKVGNVGIGGDNVVSIQSMTNTVTSDIEATVAQILRLEEAGCEIIRFAVNDEDDAKAIPLIKDRISIPVIADIQFNYRLALLAAEHGVDALRINPGNIGDELRVKEVVEECKRAGIPIRIGVNSGSISQDLLDKYGGVNSDSLVYSAMNEIAVLEKYGFYDTKVSIKSSSVPLTIEANEKFRELTDYPLHLGVTEAGMGMRGIVKSSIGIGTLLSKGIGETIRVSLSDDPVEEIKAAKSILQSLELRAFGVEIVSCPTCARTEIDLINMVRELEEATEHMKLNVKIAVMGCVVNGPGESREADYGITGGKGVGLIFKKGEIVKKVPESELIGELLKIIKEDNVVIA